jgi:hypothetical protein
MAAALGLQAAGREPQDADHVANFQSRDSAKQVRLSSNRATRPVVHSLSASSDSSRSSAEAIGTRRYLRK